MHEHDEAKRKATAARKAGDDASRTSPAPSARLGNAAVARLVQGQAISRKGGGPATLDQTIQRAIERKRGGGRELDRDVRAKLERAMGEDFSDVRVHADSEAHELSQSVSAEAFTTGSDVFFRDGRYQPGSSEGQKLLAHELTHVVQQRGAPAAAEMTVSEPGDASETEASAIADKVSSATAAAPSAPAGVSRAAEEEELQMSRIDRAGPEEELQMSRIDRAGPEEEEPLQG